MNIDYTQIKLSKKTSKYLSTLLRADVEYINIKDDDHDLIFIILEFVKDLLEEKPYAFRTPKTRSVIYDKKEKILEIYPRKEI
jgi:hypothetical protein